MNHFTRRAKKTKRKTFVKRMLAIHTKITFFFFIFYLLTSIVVDPRFLLSDFRDKYSSIAATSHTLLSLHIIGPPGKPAVSTNWVCNNSGAHIQLAWNATEDTTSYDIYKDSVLLAANITDQSYQDDVIIENSSYAYRVIANGPLGSTSSDEVVQASSHCEMRPDPTIQIKNLDGKNIESIAIPETTNRTPVFSGTTNIPNAIITINLQSGLIISSSTTTANLNGYWQWQAPVQLSYGDYQVTFTASDPLDPNWNISETKNFRIIKEEDEEKEEKNKKESEKAVSLAQTPQMSTEALPFGISVSVKNDGHAVYAGQNLLVHVNFLQKSDRLPNQDYKISYTLVNSENKNILEINDIINPFQNPSLDKSIKISPLEKNGNYKIVAKVYRGNNIISGDDFFSVKEVSLFTTGTISITSLDIMKNLGWLLLILLLILLFFLILLGIEHHLSNEAIFQITENYLNKKGFIAKRKGANQ